jgi:hypothetical protein
LERLLVGVRHGFGGIRLLESFRESIQCIRGGPLRRGVLLLSIRQFRIRGGRLRRILRLIVSSSLFDALLSFPGLLERLGGGQFLGLRGSGRNAAQLASAWRSVCPATWGDSGVLALSAS